MSEHVSNTSVSAGTSIPPVSNVTPEASERGNARSVTGKISPARAVNINKLNLDSVVRQLNFTGKSIDRALAKNTDHLAAGRVPGSAASG